MQSPRDKMIKHLNIKKHKAHVTPQKIEIGHINVLCGKNNSGKTTILEALLDNNRYSIGKEVDDADWLGKLFRPQAENFSRPDPRESINWFKGYITRLIHENTVWYSDEYNNIIEKIKVSLKKSPPLNSFNENIYTYDGVLNEFFRKSTEFFNPILIPPKRQLEFTNIIDLKQEIVPTGQGVINKLFFLKNQDLESSDYKVYKNIYETFREITGSTFNIVPNRSNQITVFYNTNDNWISASDSGLGLSDVLIIVTILNVLENNIFLVEEPENHLHAEYQKKLLRYIKSLKSKQFIITTHSSIFLDTRIVDKIFYCSKDNEVLLSDQTSKSEIINSLGYSVSENLVADVIVLLEGPTDIPVIQEMLNWLGVNNNFNIKFWPLGGDIMASLDLSVFAERNNVFALVDSDPGSSVQRTRFIRNCEEYGINCKKLERYSIENYFSLQALREVFQDQIPDSIQDISPTDSVDEQIGFKDKGKTIKTKNSQIIKNMKVEDIERTDILDFLNEIKEFLQKA